jgi:hypothetical protein
MITRTILPLTKGFSVWQRNEMIDSQLGVSLTLPCMPSPQITWPNDVGKCFIEGLCMVFSVYNTW